MEIFFIWFVFAVFIGIAAGARGRSGLGWFILAMIFTPILTAILLALLPSLAASAVAQSQTSLPVPASPQKKCPDCAEYVMQDARVCKHCSFRFPLETSEQPASDAPVAPADYTIQRQKSAAYGIGKSLGKTFKGK